MDRLSIINNQLSSKKPVLDPYEYIHLSDLITPEENAIRLKIKHFVDKEVRPVINDYVEEATFPGPVVKKLKDVDPLGLFFRPPYGQNVSLVTIGLISAELARVDLGVCTFLNVHWGLSARTIEEFGSEEQKKKYLPLMRSFDIIGGWGLTERDYGSDASNLKSHVRKVEGGYILNGNKRWIGNGNKDIMVVWAKDLDNHKNTEAFIVDLTSKGIKIEVIKNKLALRIVQNCDVTFENVFIPEDCKLPKAKTFSDTNIILQHSRALILSFAAGLCLGVYDHVIKYILARKQFHSPIAGFQLQQERLARIMATTQAVCLAAIRVQRLQDSRKQIQPFINLKDQATLGMISAMKAWTTSQAREVAKLGREMMGGDGILLENYCIKALTDAEVVYTYEGTYDINSLVTARELTGIAAFKAYKETAKDLKKPQI